MAKAKVVRKRTEAGGETSWSEINFERSGGFKAPKFTEPTLKSSKYGVALYRTNLLNDQHVRLFANGKKVAVMADERGAKKLKANKSNSRVVIPGKNVLKELNIEAGVIMPGHLGEVNGKEAWIFE